MKVIKEITGQELYREGGQQLDTWGGAVHTLSRIRDEEKLYEMEELIDELYPDGIGETELNDLLWFDREWIYEALGIKVEEDD